VGDSANVAITFQRTLLGSSTDVGYLTAGARGAQGPEGNVGNVNSTANVVTTGYFIGNGSQLTGLPSSYGNIEVATYLTTYTGNIGNVKTTANVVTTGYFLGNGSQLTGIVTGSSYGNTEVATYLPTHSGNVSAGYFLGNGSQLTGLPSSYGNTQVASYLPTYTGNLSAGATTISGNLTVGGNLIVNGNVTYINSNNVNINDSLIYLADDNPADTLDIGFVSAFTDATRYQHTGLVRDATDGAWKLFANVVAEPTTTVDFTGAIYSNLQVGTLTATAGTAELPSITTAGDTNTGMFFPAADTIAFAEGGTEVIRVNSSGQVGIGTTTPAAKLEVNATVYFGSSNNVVGGSFQIQSKSRANWNFGQLDLYRNATNTGSPRFISLMLDGDDRASTTIGAYNAIWGAYDSAPNTSSTSSTLNGAMVYGAYAGHRWVNNGTERMRIDSTGNVVISTNTASTSTTTGALIVTGGVGVGGNLFVGGALTESSSATLKENITPISGALDLILQLTGVIYDRQDGSRKNEAGLIAEEVNKVLPNLITLDDQGIPLGVQYTKLTAYLIEAVKSLKAEIDQLKKRD
jgi:hypothetical protein